MENPKLRREPITDRGTHHRKSTALLSGGTGPGEDPVELSEGIASS